MPYFTEAALQQMDEAVATVGERARALTEALILHAFTSAEAKEYARHGVGRRLSTMDRCVSRVFELLPPDSEEVPGRDVLLDTSVYLQSFVFNTFGALDGLAFIWVHEKQVTKANGKPLPNGRIGLSREMMEVRASLPVALHDYLVSLDAWFAHLESYRHALGHRIPLYVPPFMIRDEDTAQYQALDSGAREALFIHRDVEEHRRLTAARDALRFFRPVMKHSFGDPSPPTAFHPQILADFATIEELTQKVIAAL